MKICQRTWENSKVSPGPSAPRMSNEVQGREWGVSGRESCQRFVVRGWAAPWSQGRRNLSGHDACEEPGGKKQTSSYRGPSYRDKDLNSSGNFVKFWIFLITLAPMSDWSTGNTLDSNCFILKLFPSLFTCILLGQENQKKYYILMILIILYNIIIMLYNIISCLISIILYIICP